MIRYTHGPLVLRMLVLICAFVFPSSGLLAGEIIEEVSINEGISTLMELDRAYDYYDSRMQQKKKPTGHDSGIAVLLENIDPKNEMGSISAPEETKSSLTLELEKIANKNDLPKEPSVSEISTETGQNSIELEEGLSELASPDAAGTGNMTQVVESLIPLGSLGKLPLPIAKVTGKDLSGLSLAQIKNRGVGELGGSPFGPNFGKATFGSGEENSSFSGITNGTKGDEAQEKNTATELQAKKPELSEQIEALRKDMGKLAQKAEPFNENNYNTYEKAKSLFKGNENILNGMENVDPAFLTNAKELFIDHAWRDRDSNGKKFFEEFLERFEPQIRFPYPKGKEPRPKIHREGEIHLDNGRK